MHGPATVRLFLSLFGPCGMLRGGYHSLGPYWDNEEGTSTSKYRIVRRKDYWKLTVARFAEAQALLRRLPVRHNEKVLRRGIALSVELGQDWESVSPGLNLLRRRIRADRDRFVAEAEGEFRKGHPAPSGK